MSSLSPLLQFTQPLYPKVIESFSKFGRVSISGSSSYTSRALIIADILTNSQKKFSKFFFVTNGTSEQDVFIHEIKRCTGITPRLFSLIGVTDWSHSGGSISNQDEWNNQIKTVSFLSAITNNNPEFFIFPAYYLYHTYPSPSDFMDSLFQIQTGDKTSSVALFEKFIDLGYRVAEDIQSLQPGYYFSLGGAVYVWPANANHPYQIDIGFDTIDCIYTLDPESKKTKDKVKLCDVFSLFYQKKSSSLCEYFSKDTIFIEDELDITDDFYDKWNGIMDSVLQRCGVISFTLFNEDYEYHHHLHFITFLKYVDIFDLTNDLLRKKSDHWNVFLFTKSKSQLMQILRDNNVPFTDVVESVLPQGGQIYIIDTPKDDVFPYAFQNPEILLSVITDKEIHALRDEKRKTVSSGNQRVFTDLMSGLKIGDYVVHADHGIAVFLGLEQRTIDEITREYLKLGYAENDKLFVPIDQADKVSKYIGSEESMPKLTRLGSSEWGNITSKVKKETEIIAKELLKLYAERKQARGQSFKPHPDEKIIDESFPYEETPGQLKAILDVKQDMEKAAPMDRLVCGDVGFGKTEVAVRAAFRVVRNKKQVAFISPITILTDQHYRTFVKRLDPFDMRVRMLSRFVSQREQKETLEMLAKGEVDIVIGTHRLLQDDIHFKDLGLIIVDEEQRFGVKQKEALKKIKAGVDVLTLTATPIPRTLNIALNKLRDVTTITTPPPGRLPIITEVRKFSLPLIREAILREVQRGGQVYFLHNRVQTIQGMAEKLRALIPEARIDTAHGQMGSDILEQKILDFKDHKFDILVSSTIIENGIDLPNANTLIVNNSEKFGLAQLYQLRGRVGRGKTQAYAYFLYHGQRLKLDAKRRLKAIVEASDLGSGFQIAMKDLEIRGAGEILGAKQHGVINVVGVSHFIRMLNKAVEDLKDGVSQHGDEPEDVSIEVPLTCYIPDSYIVSSKDKISVYQRMAGADNFEYLHELMDDVVEDYGKMPREVSNLFRVLELKLYAKKAGVTKVKADNMHLAKEKQVIIFTLSSKVKPANIANLLTYNPKWQISGTKLQLPMSEFSMNWVDDLRECLIKLAGRITPS